MSNKAYIIQAAIPNSGVDHTLYREIDNTFDRIPLDKDLPADILADIDKLSESWWRCFENYHQEKPFSSNSTVVLNFFAEARQSRTIQIAYDALKDYLKSLGLSNIKIFINLSDLGINTYQSLNHLDIIHNPYQMRSYHTVKQGIRKIKHSHDVNQKKILYLTGRIHNDIRLYTLWKLKNCSQSHNVKHSLAMPDLKEDPDYWEMAVSYLANLTDMEQEAATHWLEQNICYLDLQAKDFHNPQGFVLDLIKGKRISAHCGGTARAPGGRSVDLNVYDDCFMQIIVESSPRCFTEKTWNAISNCMPFVHTYTSAEVQNYYAAQGYQTFVDHEYPTPDQIKLTDINIVKALELYDQRGNPHIEEKTKHNQNLFFSQCEQKEQEIKNQLGEDVFNELHEQLFFYNGYSISAGS